MVSWGGYDGGFGTGGKIRRRPHSRAAAASPYARPAPTHPPAPAARGGEGSSWLTRLISGGASRLLSSVFRKTPPQLAAPPPPEPLDAPSSRPESLDAPPSQPETLDAPPSPPPPPLEDDIPEGGENGGETANNLSTYNPENSVKDGDDTVRSSDCHGAMDLEELLKQRTFTRSEFEYLAELLRSRTVGSNTSKAEVSNTKPMHFPGKENGSRDLPVDFSIRSYSVVDQVASPAELAKAYMGSRTSMGSPLRLRLHDPSSLPIKSTEAHTIQIDKSPTLPLVPSSRLYASTLFDRIGSNYMTPNKSAIHKMSSSPYFKAAIEYLESRRKPAQVKNNAVSSKDFSGTVSSSYRPASSVHTFGRQVLKRKNTALNNESASVDPVRKMRHRYSRVSPLLETRPGHRGYLGSHASKLDEDFEQSTQTQKRRCLDKVDDGNRGDVYNRACGNSFGQAPAQSTEVAAKILKQLDTLVPSQKEGTSEIRQKQGNAMDSEDSISQRKELLTQGSLFESSSSGVQEYSLLNNINGAAKCAPPAIDGKTVNATSDRYAVLKNKSSSELITSPKVSLELDNCSGSTQIAFHQANHNFEKIQSPILEHTANSSGATNKEKSPTVSLRSYAPSNLVLSSEIDRSKLPASSNGFSFPVAAASGAHSQAPPTPPTPTMASPPILPVGKRQYSAVSSAPVTSTETAPRIFKRVPEEGSISNKHDKKLNTENPPISSMTTGHVPSFTSNPVFSVPKPATLSNGLAHTSTTSAVLPSNGSNNSVLSTNAGSSTTSFPQFSFQPGFRTSSPSAQQSGRIQFKAEPVITAPSSSTGGNFTLSNTGPISLSTSSKIFAGTTSRSVAAPSLASSYAGSGSVPFSFSPKVGSASMLAPQDKSKAGSSSTPFNFSPQFGNVSSVASLDKSKATSPESTLLSGNQFAQSGNNNSQSTQSSASNSNLIAREISNLGSLQSFVNSPSGSAPSSPSPFNSSSVFSFSAGSGSTTAPFSLPATSSALGSGTAFSASPVFGSTKTTDPPPFGMPNTDSAISPFSPTSSPIFSFTSATPTVPTPSPSTPLFGKTSPTVGFSTGTDQMNDKNQSPFSTTPFGVQSISPSTPALSTPATQFASTTSASPGIFQFGQQSQASSGGFSMGTGGGNDKSGRRIVKVKRKK